MFVSVLGQTAERKKKEERKIVGFRSRQPMGSGDLKLWALAIILVADYIFLLIEKCLYSQDHKASMRPAL